MVPGGDMKKEEIVILGGYGSTGRLVAQLLLQETTVKIRDEIRNVLRYTAHTPLRSQLRDRIENAALSKDKR